MATEAWLQIGDSGDAAPLNLLDKTNYRVPRLLQSSGRISYPVFAFQPNGQMVTLPIACIGPNPTPAWNAIDLKFQTAREGAGPHGMAESHVVLMIKYPGNSDYDFIDVDDATWDPQDLFMVGGHMGAKATLICKRYARTAPTTLGPFSVSAGGNGIWLGALGGTAPALLRPQFTDQCTGGQRLARLRWGVDDHTQLVQADLNPYLSPSATGFGSNISDATARGTTLARLTPTTNAPVSFANVLGPTSVRANRRAHLYAKIRTNDVVVGPIADLTAAPQANSGGLSNGPVTFQFVPVDASGNPGPPGAIQTVEITNILPGQGVGPIMNPFYHIDFENQLFTPPWAGAPTNSVIDGTAAHSGSYGLDIGQAGAGSGSIAIPPPDATNVISNGMWINLDTNAGARTLTWTDEFGYTVVLTGAGTAWSGALTDYNHPTPGLAMGNWTMAGSGWAWLEVTFDHSNPNFLRVTVYLTGNAVAGAVVPSSPSQAVTLSSTAQLTGASSVTTTTSTSTGAYSQTNTQSASGSNTNSPGSYSQTNTTTPGSYSQTNTQGGYSQSNSNAQSGSSSTFHGAYTQSNSSSVSGSTTTNSVGSYTSVDNPSGTTSQTNTVGGYTQTNSVGSYSQSNAQTVGGYTQTTSTSSSSSTTNNTGAVSMTQTQTVMTNPGGTSNSSSTGSSFQNQAGMAIPGIFAYSCALRTFIDDIWISDGFMGTTPIAGGAAVEFGWENGANTDHQRLYIYPAAPLGAGKGGSGGSLVTEAGTALRLDMASSATSYTLTSPLPSGAVIENPPTGLPAGQWTQIRACPYRVAEAAAAIMLVPGIWAVPKYGGGIWEWVDLGEANLPPGVTPQSYQPKQWGIMLQALNPNGGTTIDVDTVVIRNAKRKYSEWAAPGAIAKYIWDGDTRPDELPSCDLLSTGDGGGTGQASVSGPLLGGPGGTWLVPIMETNDGNGNPIADAVHAAGSVSVIVTARNTLSAGV